MKILHNKPFLKGLKILILLMVMINLLSCTWSINGENILKNKTKSRLGSHWNRIGKRFEFHQQTESSQERKIKNKFIRYKGLIFF